MHEVIMPKLGLTMESGVIEKWHKQEGDLVQEGEVLFEVMTDKVSLEVESYYSGYLRKILKKEGEEVPVTEVVAYIGEKDEPLIIKKKGKEQPKIEITSQAISEQSLKPAEASPLARKLAQQKNIDLSLIKGTGPKGRIVKQDIEAYQAKSAERIKISPYAKKLSREKQIDYSCIKGSGPGGRIVARDIESAVPEAGKETSLASNLTAMRRTIAQRMVQSYQSIPHVYFKAKAEADKLIALREKLKSKAQALYGAGITYSDFMLKIAASVIKEFPAFNSSLENDRLIIHQDINIGLAVSIEGGLVVPVISHADQLTLVEIAKKRADLVNRARQGSLSGQDLANGTFTVSNLGMYSSVREFTAIINPPQAAIMSVGAIYKEPGLDQDKVVPKSFVNITLAVDHRILDGAIAAQFLDRIVEHIQNPELLVI